MNALEKTEQEKVGTRVIHFSKSKEIRNYPFNGQNLEFEVTPEIFPASPHGVFLAGKINVEKNDTLIDIGTGSGILAIAAAKLGAKAFATDTSMDAIETAKRNALRNNTEVEFSQGKYFAGFNGNFDVILANLPHEIVHKSYRKAIGNNLTQTIDGGKKGNEKILKFLTLAKEHMDKHSKIYLLVYTMSDYLSTIKKMLSNYDVKLLDFVSASTKEFVEDNINWYKTLNEEGKVNIFKKGKKWLAYVYLFELTLKKNN